MKFSQKHLLQGVKAIVCTILLAIASTPVTATILLMTSRNYPSPIGSWTITMTLQDNYLGDFSLYWWQYDIHNISFNPPGGNGLSGFELALPAFPPDLGNVSAPPGWNNNCCSGQPEEWDIPQPGVGILPGADGVFSFTSLPRTITNSTGYVHSWTAPPFSTQFDVTTYASTGVIGPEVPNVLLPPLPEPATLALLAVGLGGLGLSRRRKLS